VTIRSLRRTLLCRDDGRLPPAGQVLEAVGVEQRLVKVSPLLNVHLGQRWEADDLPDAAAQLRARD
jgi:hypothetical protein